MLVRISSVWTSIHLHSIHGNNIHNHTIILDDFGLIHQRYTRWCHFICRSQKKLVFDETLTQAGFMALNVVAQFFHWGPTMCVPSLNRTTGAMPAGSREASVLSPWDRNVPKGPTFSRITCILVACVKSCSEESWVDANKHQMSLLKLDPFRTISHKPDLKFLIKMSSLLCLVCICKHYTL